MSVRLTPLEATIYYFFLINKNGLQINALYRHENVLYDIYGKFSVANSDNNIAAMHNRISMLVNLLDNSLSEKISKIKSKFIKALGVEMAEQYYISRQGDTMKYKIKIDRGLVEYKE